MKNLIVWSKIEDGFGNHVRGHVSRTNSVVSALVEISEKNIQINQVFSERDFRQAVNYYGYKNVVAIIDNGYSEFDGWLPENSLVISDIDVSFHSTPRVISVPSSNINIGFWQSPGISYKIYRDASIIDPLTSKFNHSGAYGHVSLIPGGARDVFFNEYEIRIEPVLNEALGSDVHVHILENLSKGDLFEEACSSRFVVCTPSVVSGEMIAMGVPFIAIKTADDQQPYWDKYKLHNVINQYSYGIDIWEFAESPYPLTKDIITKKHVYSLAQDVYKMLMEKH